MRKIYIFICKILSICHSLFLDKKQGCVVILFLLFAISLNGYAINKLQFNKPSHLHTLEKSIEKNNKNFIKNLKKVYDYKNVNVICGSSDDFWYIVNKKENNRMLFGLLDKNGKTILDVKYNSIDIIPSTIENQVVSMTLWYDPSITHSVHVKECATRFVACTDNNGFLFDELGKELFKSKYNYAHLLPGFVIFCEPEHYLASKDIYPYRFMSFGNFPLEGNGDFDKAFGLKFDLVTNLADVVFSDIVELKLFNDNSPDDLQGMCAVVKSYDNGFKGWGAFHSMRYYPNVPPLFCNISCDLKNGITVSQKKHQAFKPFDLQKVYYMPDYEDEGEYLYEVGQYKKALDFFDSKDSLTSIDVLRAGLSQAEFLRAELPREESINAVGRYQNVNNWWNGNYKRFLEWYENDVFYNHLFKARDYLNLYLGMDTTYQSIALKELQELSDYERKIENSHRCYSNKYQELLQANRENDLGYQLQKALLNGIQQGISKSIDKTVNSLTSSSNKRGSTATRKSTVSTSSKSSNSSSSSSNSNSGQLSPQVEAQIRKIEKYIEDEKQRLEDATKRYNSNPTTSGKLEIDAHKKAIQGYYKQINELRK